MKNEKPHMKNTQTPFPKRKALRFDGAAKTVVSALAATTLLGGWNLIAHLDNAQADAKADGAASVTSTVSPTATKPASPPPLRLPTLAPLTIASVPTLQPAPDLAQPRAAAMTNPVVFSAAELPALAPLPTLAPLPSLPNLPPPSAPSGSGSNNNGGGGNTSSGGS